LSVNGDPAARPEGGGLTEIFETGGLCKGLIVRVVLVFFFQPEQRRARAICRACAAGEVVG
jgi:hypothetical protein